MDRYELSAEDMELMDAVFRLALGQLARARRDDAVAKLTVDTRDMHSRFGAAHVVFIETEETQL